MTPPTPEQITALEAAVTLPTEACRSFSRGSLVCADGFIQKPYCSGRAGCHVCGHVSDNALPYCLRDTLPAHFIHENGHPVFYRAAHTEEGQS